MLEIEPSAPVAPGLSDGRAGWPWESEPYRLWSLWDMRRVSVALMSAAMRLGDAKGALATRDDLGAAARAAQGAIRDFMKECQSLPLSKEFMFQARNVHDGLGNLDLGLLHLIKSIHDLQQAFVMALTDYLFFAVPPDRKWIYLDPPKWFGEDTILRFHEISRDVRDACQCFALAQWTATVFHCMRVLESGLRDFAGRIGTSQKTPLNLLEWQQIINEMNVRIAALRQAPKGQQRSDDLEFLSRVALQFGYFKDAYRNHVSHARVDYDEQGAITVLTQVRDFMALLSSQP